MRWNQQNNELIGELSEQDSMIYSFMQGRLEIVASGNPTQTRILIDGRPFENIRTFNVHQRVDRPTLITIELEDDSLFPSIEPVRQPL